MQSELFGKKQLFYIRNQIEKKESYYQQDMRHYYDLAMMAKNNEVKDRALADFSLLEDVIRFKQKFYPTTWAKYEEIETNGLKLLPQDFRLNALEKDYKAMQNMIFDKRLTFFQIIDTLQSLEQEIDLKFSCKKRKKI